MAKRKASIGFILSGLTAGSSVLGCYISWMRHTLFFLGFRILSRGQVGDTYAYVGGLGSCWLDTLTAQDYAVDQDSIPYKWLWTACGGAIALGSCCLLASPLLGRLLQGWKHKVAIAGCLLLLSAWLCFSYVTFVAPLSEDIMIGPAYWLLGFALSLGKLGLILEQETPRPKYIRSERLTW